MYRDVPTKEVRHQQHQLLFARNKRTLKTIYILLIATKDKRKQEIKDYKHLNEDALDKYLLFLPISHIFPFPSVFYLPSIPIHLYSSFRPTRISFPRHSAYSYSLFFSFPKSRQGTLWGGMQPFQKHRCIYLLVP